MRRDEKDSYARWYAAQHYMVREMNGKDEGGRMLEERKLTLLEPFNLMQHTFILPPSSLLLITANAERVRHAVDVVEP